MGELLHSTPLRPSEYVWGKFLAALLASFAAVLVLPMSTGLLTHLAPDPGSPDIYGPFRLMAYVRPTLVFLVPAVVFTAGVTLRPRPLDRTADPGLPLSGDHLPALQQLPLGDLSAPDQRGDVGRPALCRSVGLPLAQGELAAGRPRAQPSTTPGRSPSTPPSCSAGRASSSSDCCWWISPAATSPAGCAGRPASGGSRSASRAGGDPAALRPGDELASGGFPPDAWRWPASSSRSWPRSRGSTSSSRSSCSSSTSSTGIPGAPSSMPLMLLTPGTAAVQGLSFLTLALGLLFLFYTVESLERERTSGIAPLFYATPVPHRRHRRPARSRRTSRCWRSLCSARVRGGGPDDGGAGEGRRSRSGRS